MRVCVWRSHMRIIAYAIRISRLFHSECDAYTRWLIGGGGFSVARMRIDLIDIIKAIDSVRIHLAYMRSTSAASGSFRLVASTRANPSKQRSPFARAIVVMEFD